MRAFKLLAAIVVVYAVGLISYGELARVKPDNLNEWLAYKQKYGKVYETPEEDAMRYEQFVRSLTKIHLEVGEFSSHLRGLNHLSDWARDELNQLNGLKFSRVNLKANLSNTREANEFIENLLNDETPVPDELDWRQTPGRVGPVKFQGKCGSCWAFSITGMLEGQETSKRKSLTLLSEQDLLDCSKSNFGCDGGLLFNALCDITLNGGIDSETAYPYEAKVGACRFDKSKTIFRSTSPAILAPFDEKQLKQVVAKYGPVSVGMDASDLFDYKSGVYKSKKCNQILNNHAVLIVGYGTNKREGDFWIVKNSWNSTWGEQGYFRIGRGENVCAIAAQPVIATKVV